MSELLTRVKNLSYWHSLADKQTRIAVGRRQAEDDNDEGERQAQQTTSIKEMDEDDDLVKSHAFSADVNRCQRIQLEICWESRYPIVHDDDDCDEFKWCYVVAGWYILDDDWVWNLCDDGDHKNNTHLCHRQTITGNE